MGNQIIGSIKFSDDYFSSYWESTILNRPHNLLLGLPWKMTFSFDKAWFLRLTEFFQFFSAICCGKLIFFFYFFFNFFAVKSGQAPRPIKIAWNTNKTTNLPSFENWPFENYPENVKMAENTPVYETPACCKMLMCSWQNPHRRTHVVCLVSITLSVIALPVSAVSLLGFTFSQLKCRQTFRIKASERLARKL